MDNAQPLPPAIDPTLEPIREAVRKLPPYPFRVDGDEMRTDYVNGLKACETPDALRDFITRWAPLWTISFQEPGETFPEWDALVRGTYDPDAVFAAIQVFRADTTPMGEDELERLLLDLPHRIAMDVLLPHAMVVMDGAANHFGVPVNVAWIQAVGLVELF